MIYYMQELLVNQREYIEFSARNQLSNICICIYVTQGNFFFFDDQI